MKKIVDSTCEEWGGESWVGPLIYPVLVGITNPSYTILLKGRVLLEDYSKINW